MIGLRTSDFHATVMLLEPLIVPILRQVRTVQDGPEPPVATDSEEAGPIALWRWMVPVAGGQLYVHLHVRAPDALITSLQVLYRGPVIGEPQFALASRVRREIEERSGIRTDADWQRTKRR
jgi:hypothetical protein